MTPTLLVQFLSIPGVVRKSGPRIQSVRRDFKGANTMKMIRNFLRDESGMETLEYAVIAGLIAVAAAIIYASNGTWANTIKDRLANAAAQS